MGVGNDPPRHELHEKSFQFFEFPTLVDILRWRALYQPEQLAFTYLVDGEIEEANLYNRLH